jgi:hypothetical protein
MSVRSVLSMVAPRWLQHRTWTDASIAVHAIVSILMHGELCILHWLGKCKYT